MKETQREGKELEIYLNYKPLIQVNSLKYLVIILDSKLTFKDHISTMTEKSD